MRHAEIRRALDEAFNRKGMIVGLPKVTVDASQLQALIRHADAGSTRIAELEAALMEYGMHTYDENGEPCYGDQLTRCVDEDGNAEKYACTCGFSAALPPHTEDGGEG